MTEDELEEMISKLWAATEYLIKCESEVAKRHAAVLRAETRVRVAVLKVAFAEAR